MSTLEELSLIFIIKAVIPCPHTLFSYCSFSSFPIMLPERIVHTSCLHFLNSHSLLTIVEWSLAWVICPVWSIWLCLRKKKTHKAFPFLPFGPPMCVIYLVTKLWMLIECIKGIITQSRELFCCIFKLPCAWLPTAEQEQVKDFPEIKHKGTREGEQVPTWEFAGLPWRKGQLPGARQFGINAITSG